MAAPTSFSITYSSSTPGSGQWQGALVWTITAPWGFATATSVKQGTINMLNKGAGPMALYLTNGTTDSNEVPL